MSQENTESPYKSLRILILEDVPEDAELIRFHLEKAGYILNAKIVDDEASFKKALNTFNPDVILSDYSLPTFSGLEALLIASDVSPTTPFVFVTGAVGEEIAAETIISGASGFVLKSNLPRLCELIDGFSNEKDHLRTQRIKRTNERIRARIDANQDALKRIHHFLATRKNNDPEWEDTMRGLEYIKSELLGDDAPLPDDQVDT